MLLKSMQVVISHWVSIAIFNKHNSSSPQLGATLKNRPEWKFLWETWRLVVGVNSILSQFPGELSWLPSYSRSSISYKFRFQVEGSELVPLWTSRPELKLAASSRVWTDVVWIYAVVTTGLRSGWTLGIILMLGRERNRNQFLVNSKPMDLTHSWWLWK